MVLMDKVLVRYAELGLKSERVRARFTRQLMDHITDSLLSQGIEHVITSQRGRIFIETSEIEETIDLLGGIPGIHSFSIVKTCTSKFDGLMDGLAQYSRDLLREGMSFGIKVRRTGETDYSSRDVAINGGDAVCRHLDDSKVSVDLKDPDIWFEVEIRGDNAYLFTERIKGMGGMPSSTQGKVLLYLPPEGSLSGDKDEIYSRTRLSRLMMLRRGCRVIPVVRREDREGWDDILEELKEKGKDPFFLDLGDVRASLIDALKKTGAMGVVHPGSEGDLADHPDISGDGRAVSVFMPTVGFSKDEVDSWLLRLEGGRNRT